MDQADRLDQERLREVHPNCGAVFVPGPSGGIAQMFACPKCGIEFTIPGPPGAFAITTEPFDKKRVRIVYGIKV